MPVGGRSSLKDAVMQFLEVPKRFLGLQLVGEQAAVGDRASLGVDET